MFRIYAFNIRFVRTRIDLLPKVLLPRLQGKVVKTATVAATLYLHLMQSTCTLHGAGVYRQCLY